MTRGQFWGMVLFTILVLGGSGGGFAAWFYANSTNRLISAVRQSDAQTVQLEIDRGAKVNVYTALDPANGEGVIELGTTPATVITVTPLMIAAKNGDMEIVELLINAKVNVSADDSQGKNVCHYACQTAGNSEILRILIANGAEVFSVNPMGESTINNCIRLNDVEMLRIILDDVNGNKRYREFRGYGRYAEGIFQLAIQNNNVEIIEALIDAKFSPLNENPYTGQPEWWLIFDNYFSEEQSYEMIKALVKKSPERLYKRTNSDRPLEYAVNQQNWAAAIAIIRLADEFDVPILLPAWLSEKIRKGSETNFEAEKLFKLIKSNSNNSGNNG